VTPGLTDAITRDRFASWAKVLKKVSSTPFLCVGIGHGEQQGNIHITQVEDLSNDQVIAFLEQALALLKSKPGGSGT
jgi:hypothetical protein